MGGTITWSFEVLQDFVLLWSKSINLTLWREHSRKTQHSWDNDWQRKNGRTPEVRQCSKSLVFKVRKQNLSRQESLIDESGLDVSLLEVFSLSERVVDSLLQRKFLWTADSNTVAGSHRTILRFLWRKHWETLASPIPIDPVAQRDESPLNDSS